MGSSISNKCAQYLATSSASPVDNRLEPDTVHLSRQGRLLALDEPLLLPSAANVRKMAAALSDGLHHAFHASGISPHPPVEFDVDETNGEIRVKGNRADLHRIVTLLDANPHLRRQIRNVAAISRHAIHMHLRMKLQHDCRAGIDTTNAATKYAQSFGEQKPMDLCLHFDNEGIQVLAYGSR